MIPSREHFLLNLLNALSIFSFSPTRTVDIYNPPLPIGGYSFFNSLKKTKRGKIVNGFSAVFSKFGKITAAFYAKKVE